MIFVVEVDWGMGLKAARTLASARAQALRENGTHHPRGVRKATADDIAHVRAMGGHVPDDEHQKRRRAR
jgi:hypothetical protein